MQMSSNFKICCNLKIRGLAPKVCVAFLLFYFCLVVSDRNYDVLKSKNPCFLLNKNDTHVKKVRHTTEFSFPFPEFPLLINIDELWKSQKNRTLKKWKQKKIAADIIILHMYTKNYNYTRYSSYNTEQRVRQMFFVILGHISSFYRTPSAPNMIIWCMLTQIWSETDITLSFSGLSMNILQAGDKSPCKEVFSQI